MSDLYRECTECCGSGWIDYGEGDEICPRCGASGYEKVEIDYKAAYTAYDEHGSNMSDPSLAALRAAIDAALGIGGDDE